MKATNKEKLEQFDALKARADALGLAVHDLVNKRFSAPVTVRCADYVYGETGFVKVRMSWRGMPLFLVSTHAGYTAVYTDTDVIAMQHSQATFERMLTSARNQLIAKHMEEERKTA